MNKKKSRERVWTRENFISDLLKSQERGKISFNEILEGIFSTFSQKKFS
jgi:hypothetical protein